MFPPDTAPAPAPHAIASGAALVIDPAALPLSATAIPPNGERFKSELAIVLPCFPRAA